MIHNPTLGNFKLNAIKHSNGKFIVAQSWTKHSNWMFIPRNHHWAWLSQLKYHRYWSATSIQRVIESSKYLHQYFVCLLTNEWLSIWCIIIRWQNQIENIKTGRWTIENRAFNTVVRNGNIQMNKVPAVCDCWDATIHYISVVSIQNMKHMNIDYCSSAQNKCHQIINWWIHFISKFNHLHRKQNERWKLLITIHWICKHLNKISSAHKETSNNSMSKYFNPKDFTTGIS